MQPNFGSTHLSRAHIPIPPLLERERIVAKVKDLVSHCDELETKLMHAEKASEELVENLLNG